jgi:hypothetical protein
MHEHYGGWKNKGNEGREERYEKGREIRAR